MTKNKETVVCEVSESGTISPYFREVTNGSSGFLKYFHNLKGCNIKITIEVLDEED